MDRARLSILDSWVFIAVILLAGAAGLAVIFLQQKVVTTRAYAARNQSVDQLIASLSDVEVRTGTVVSANEEASLSLDRTEKTETQIAGDLAKIDTRVTAIETKRLALEGRVDETRTKLAQARKDVEGNKGKVDEFEAEVKKRLVEDENVETEVEEGEEAMRTIDREVDTTRGVLNGFETNIDVIKVKLADGERLLGQATDEIQSMDNSLKGLNTFVERLEKETKETGDESDLLSDTEKRANDRWCVVVRDGRKDPTFFDGLKSVGVDEWVKAVQEKGYMETDRAGVSVLCWYYPRVMMKNDGGENWSTSTKLVENTFALVMWVDVEQGLCDVLLGRAKVLEQTGRVVQTKKQGVTAALSNLRFADANGVDRMSVYALTSENVTIDQCDLDEMTKDDVAVLVGLVKSTYEQRLATASTTNKEDGPAWSTSSGTLLYLSKHTRLDKFEYGDENKGVFDISFSAEWPFTRT